jgi:ABC-type Mn2+/Zn2+ transport system ATPase subunit
VITQFQAKDFGCLKDVTVQLTPFHAFIGPNDSGKSTLLRAIRAAMNMASKGQSLSGHFNSLSFELSNGCAFNWNPISRTPDISLTLKQSKHPFQHGTENGTPTYKALGIPDKVLNDLRGAALFRFDPDDLRYQTRLIPEFLPLTLSERGQGLPSVYDAILSRGDETFQAIASQVRKHFPTVKSLRLKAVSESTKTFEIELLDGTKVGADQFSEGLLYYLAFAALPYLDPVSLLLIEEPENGLHPARIAEVVRVLREISRTGVQVLVATHSPLVINEMEADEVSVLTRTQAEGTRVTRLKDTPNFEQRSKLYALGELWLSYANGIDEAPLFQQAPKP